MYWEVLCQELISLNIRKTHATMRSSRVMLPAANAVSHGYKRILIIANDIDIVLGISCFGDIGADKLWV